jgi:hypothetical protein
MYACLFIACRAENMSFDGFLAQFSQIDTHKNDRLVTKAFRYIFKQEPYTKGRATLSLKIVREELQRSFGMIADDRGSSLKTSGIIRDHPGSSGMIRDDAGSAGK